MGNSICLRVVEEVGVAADDGAAGGGVEVEYSGVVLMLKVNSLVSDLLNVEDRKQVFCGRRMKTMRQ